MKKLLTLLLALCMLLGCAAFAETTDYLGVWVLTSMESFGITMDPSAPGLDAVMTINADGTCVQESLGEVMDCTWAETETGIVVNDAEGDLETYTYVDGTLVLEQDGLKLIFEMGVWPLANQTLADFSGDWELDCVEYLGEFMSTEEVGLTAKLHLEEGKGRLEMTDDAWTEVYDGVCELEEAEGFGTLMYFMVVDPATGEQDGSGMVLALYSDGELALLEVDEEDNDVFYCFVRVEEGSGE